MSQSNNLASLPTPRKIQTLSSPQLVATIRRLSKECAVYKLLHNGKESIAQGRVLKLALAEAAKRQLTINHPELLE